MSTIVRLKRCLEEDPLEALIINSKRRKPNDLDTDNATAIFKFAGTVQNEESPLKPIILKNEENKFQVPLKHRAVNITEKVKEKVQNASKSSRLKIINSFRTVDDTSETALENLETIQSIYTVVEVEPTVIKSDENDVSQAKYVYDIYCTESTNFDDFSFDNLESVEPLEDLIFGQFREVGDPEESDQSQDDSNDENNWRNEYPDSDLDDEDILNAMSACKIVNNDDDENYLSSTDDEGRHYEMATYQDVALKHGKRYAQFKARLTHDSDDNEDDDEYYSDQDECGIDRDQMYDHDDD